jgi:hypothetical protein
MRERILAAYRMLGAATYKDVMTFLQVKKSKKVLRRISDAVRVGSLIDTGERKITSKGRVSAVYVLADKIKTDKEAKKKTKKRKVIRQSGYKIQLPTQGEFFQ